MPTGSAKAGSSIDACTKAVCRSIAARIAWRAEVNTAITSSPRNSRPVPPPGPSTVRAIEAKRIASDAAASSPCCCVNVV